MTKINAIPNLKHLHAFCAVADFHNISRASEAVFLSQSAVSQALSKLSEHLDTPLIIRKGSGVILTDEAISYVHRVKRAFEILKNGLDDILKSQNQTVQKSNYLLHHLTHTQLKAFIAVSETNNYTHASKHIFTSQSAVYRSIQELVQLLNTPLFEKTSQGLQLSRLGLIFYKSCKLAFAELLQGQMDIQLLQNKGVGRITIGCMPLARHELLPKAINLFSEMYPKINLSIIESPYDTLINRLKLGEIDFLIGALRPNSEISDIIQEQLFDSTLCIVADKHHPLTHKSLIDIEDLLKYTWILPTHGTPTRNRFENMVAPYYQYREVDLHIIECSSMSMVRGLLKQSLRLALISRQQINMELELGLLKIIAYDVNDTPRQIGITIRENWVASEIHKTFFECLKKIPMP